MASTGTFAAFAAALEPTQRIGLGSGQGGAGKLHQLAPDQRQVQRRIGIDRGFGGARQAAHLQHHFHRAQPVPQPRPTSGIGQCGAGIAPHRHRRALNRQHFIAVFTAERAIDRGPRPGTITIRCRPAQQNRIRAFIQIADQRQIQHKAFGQQRHRDHRRRVAIGRCARRPIKQRHRWIIAPPFQRNPPIGIQHHRLQPHRRRHPGQIEHFDRARLKIDPAQRHRMGIAGRIEPLPPGIARHQMAGQIGPQHQVRHID